MTCIQFGEILEKMRPFITKRDTSFRNCIGPAERLQLTLRYLATGNNIIYIHTYMYIKVNKLK